MQRASARTWSGLVVLLLPALLVSMDISILFIASPAIVADLAPTATQLLWMMDLYSFVLAGLLVTMGGLGDRIGRRRLLMIGGVAFGAASLAVALAPSPEWFIAGRALLGVGAATLAPSTLALIRSMFADATERRTAVAAWTVAFTGGAVIGPVLGGLLLEHCAWGAVFLINLPVMVVLLVTAPLLVPEARDPRPARFDLLGALLSLVAILGVVYGVKRFADHGTDVSGAVSLMLGLLLLGVFVRRQQRVPHPLIDLTLFRNGAFGGAAVVSTLASLVMVGTGLLAFTFLQTVHGMRPLDAALAALPTVAGAALGAAVVAVLGQRVRPALLLAAGLLVGAAGMAVIGGVTPDTSVVAFVVGYTVLTFGIGGVSTVAGSLILTTAPPERAGAAASVSETGVALGDALGIALFGTVSALVYRDQMVRAGIGGAPAETIGGAVAAAEGPGDELLRTAAEAFTTSVNTVASIGAAVLVLTAFGALRALRRVPAAL